MASIFKRIRNGKPSKKWFIGYCDHEGRRRETVGTTDKTTTERIAARLEAEADLRRRGIIDPTEEKFCENGKLRIDSHLDAFEAHLESKGDTPKYVDATISCCRSVIEACGFQVLADLDAGKIAMLIQDLRRQGCGMTAINARLTAIKGFSRWLWRTDRLRSDGLKIISKLNARTDRRHRRRALTEDEIGRLLTAAEKGGQASGMTGMQRAMVYRLCLETGLRAAEVRSLTPRSFNLTDPYAASMTVQAAYSKHRREDVLPIRSDLAGRVEQYVDGMAESQRVFKLPEKTAKMLRIDLAAAGIPYRDGSDHVADFHALRHTFITRLVRSGVAPAVAQKLARHSTITLTLDYYTHVFVDDERDALDRLPPLDADDDSQSKTA